MNVTVGGKSIINEIIISNRIPRTAVLTGEVNTIIRIADKNKWRPGSIFGVKFSNKDKESIPVLIEESKEVVARDISAEVLLTSGYKNQNKFREQWENWNQKWNSKAWVIKFSVTHPTLLINAASGIYKTPEET